jgi:hypothetical protein
VFVEIVLVAKGQENGERAVAFDVGDAFVCVDCAEVGFHSALAVAFGEGIRALNARDVVAEMDIRETYDDVPKCGHCGERVVAEKMFKYWDDLMKVPR